MPATNNGAYRRMRFLGLGDFCSLGDMYLRLAQDGHEVRVYVGDADAHDIFAGMIDRVDDWRTEIPWIREADGIVICETADLGDTADALRASGIRVVGGSAFADRLERDRAFGQAVMAGMGLQTAPTYAFDDYDDAIAYLTAHPGRYVYKLSDGVAASTRNYVGQMTNGWDVLAMLRLEKTRLPAGQRANFVLMEFVQGVEVGVGAYFNGEEFLRPACIDWEHKRFFPGDLGELTGEMGTVVSYRGSEILFESTLARLAPQLRAARHQGYVNLNTIVNAQGVWPLEFTCRFGYPGFAICDALHVNGWEEILRLMTDASLPPRFETHPGFAVGVVVTVPPFPYEYGYEQLSKGAPIFLEETMTAADRDHLHFGEVRIDGGQLLTAGALGYVLVATGIGIDVPTAQQAAYARVRQVVVPNMRYRIDIGDRWITHDAAAMRGWEYW